MKRFWEKVNIGEPDECWEWRLGRDSDGYGRFKLDRVEKKAHRFAWELTSGQIPDGLCICHHCDNPPCCNPTHLFLGTNADNMADCVAKGRRDERKGADNAMAKLTEDHVHLIRHCIELGCKHREIADVFGVSNPTISRINTGKRWSHV